MRRAISRPPRQRRTRRRLASRLHLPREPEWVVRFNLSQRLEHAVLLVCFIILVVTGLPQRYPDLPAATWTIEQFGGIDNARLIHRVFAAAFTFQALYHIATIGIMGLRGRLRPTMVPNMKDVIDALTMLRYSTGSAPEPPKFGRYEYRQKFEYWGIIFGSTIMISSGLLLWFPALFTEVLPGQVIAAAREAHGGEATLALLTIVTWHLYSVLLSPSQFPGDYSIFTGRISRERMLEEHPLEYAQILAAEAAEPAYQRLEGQVVSGRRQQRTR